jgi:uncharacterized phage protein (TIGR01671 family)
MREIKFRAWDKLFLLMRSDGFSVSANGDPVGYFIEPDVTPNTTRICGEWRGDSTIILMQFTGLRDKNGKEIYEGDIVTAPYRVGPQRIDFGIGEEGEPADGMGSYIGWCIGGEECTGFTQYEADEFEVIGNIYENPPLY